MQQAAIQLRFRKAYGWLANPLFTSLHNAVITLGGTPSWFYFDNPSHIAFHNLCDTIQPLPNLKLLLGLGLKFIQTQRYSTTNLNYTLNRFRKHILTKCLMAGSTPNPDWNIKLHIRSNKTFEHCLFLFNRRLLDRVKHFSAAVRKKIRLKRTKQNLIKTQRFHLDYLINHKEFVTVKADKNLGTIIMNSTTYKQRALIDHLRKPEYYSQLHITRALALIENLKTEIYAWILKYNSIFTQQERKFLTKTLENNKDPFSYFYLLIKIHKTPWATRPIVSYAGSIAYGLGIWLNDKLQLASQKGPTYLKNSKDLVDRLNSFGPVPPGAKLFTADANSMYTNIDTEHALIQIGNYLLNEPDFVDLPVDAIFDGLRLLMESNIFKFDDTYWIQESGAAMGAPPSCDYAMLYFYPKEIQLLATFGFALGFLVRYIDDMLGLWLPGHDDLWSRFKADTNFSKRYGRFFRSYHFYQKWSIYYHPLGKGTQPLPLHPFPLSSPSRSP